MPLKAGARWRRFAHTLTGIKGFRCGTDVERILFADGITKADVFAGRPAGIDFCLRKLANDGLAPKSAAAREPLGFDVVFDIGNGNIVSGRQHLARLSAHPEK